MYEMIGQINTSAYVTKTPELIVDVCVPGEAEPAGRPHGPVQLPAQARPAHGQVRPAAQADHQRVSRDRAGVS